MAAICRHTGYMQLLPPRFYAKKVQYIWLGRLKILIWGHIAIIIV